VAVNYAMSELWTPWGLNKVPRGVTLSFTWTAKTFYYLAELERPTSARLGYVTWNHATPSHAA
jgi:hypothetical protein